MKKARFFLAVCVCLGLAAVMAEDNGILVPNRLANAKVGEWASYRLPDGYIQKLTVAKRLGSGPEALVTVKIENIYDGEVVTVHEITQEAGESPTAPRIPAEEGMTVSVRKDSATVKDKTYPVTIVQLDRYTGDEEDDRSTEWWSTPDIPVFGIIKRVEDGELQWEIEDWGEAQ